MLETIETCMYPQHPETCSLIERRPLNNQQTVLSWSHCVALIGYETQTGHKRTKQCPKISHRSLLIAYSRNVVAKQAIAVWAMGDDGRNAKKASESHNHALVSVAIKTTNQINISCPSALLVIDEQTDIARGWKEFWKKAKRFTAAI